MKAVQVNEYGTSDVLTHVELDTPRPGPGEVAIDVEYAGVNFAEVMFRRGQFKIGVPHVPGLEVSGTVAALGPGVTGPTIGRRVAALTLAGGGYAETVVTRADWTAPLDGPATDLPPLLAAALPCNAPVAMGLLEDAARLRVGETVLVTAPAGGVGAIVAQLARRMGASAVYGVTGSPDKTDYALGLGYDRVFTPDQLAQGIPDATHGLGVDILLDSIGGPLRASALDLLAPLGRCVIFGDASDHDTSFPGDTLWAASKSITGYNLGALAHARPTLIRDRLHQALTTTATGDLRVDVTELPLAEAAKAHDILESRAGTGKYVLRVR
ncbi:zinc-binding dehydrogenase [Streptomyces amakusaensis]|uniref:Zinc-binding alcohol dehydrogenase family protein n=1 Tax=Streptomyces amakusaensis TaxID=67271 RepID=A0ABW0A9F4_9ACTN